MVAMLQWGHPLKGMEIYLEVSSEQIERASMGPSPERDGNSKKTHRYEEGWTCFNGAIP